MKRLLVVIAFLILAGGVVFAVKKKRADAPPAEPHLTVQLRDGKLVVNGELTEGSAWLERWKVRVAQLAEIEGTDKDDASAVQLKKTRLYLKLDPELAKQVLEDILIVAAKKGFVKYDIRCGPGPILSLSIPGRKVALPNGTYECISLLLPGAEQEKVDVVSLAKFARERTKKLVLVQVIAASDVALGRFIPAVRAALGNAEFREVSFGNNKDAKIFTTGRQNVELKWEAADVELIDGMHNLVVPKEILDKAELGENFETIDPQ
jgi:hypothetical protein